MGVLPGHFDFRFVHLIRWAAGRPQPICGRFASQFSANQPGAEGVGRPAPLPRPGRGPDFSGGLADFAFQATRSFCAGVLWSRPQHVRNSRVHYTKKRSHFHGPIARFYRPNQVVTFSISGAPLKALRKARLQCLDQFPVFEVVLKKRGRTWRWCVCTTEGDLVMQGSQRSRPTAKYKAHRALFMLLLSAPYRSIQLSTPRSSEETI